MNATVALAWASDLAATGQASLETLVRDSQLGSLLRHAAHTKALEFLLTHRTTMLLLPLLALVWLIYYLSFHVRRPHLVYPVTSLNSAIVHGLPRLHRAYWPTFYLTHEILQAAVGSFVRLDPRIKRDPHFEREIRTMADGEQIALDWLGGSDVTDESPIVFTCHGLAGHTDELNMQYLALGVRSAGFRFAIFNRRGCALDMKLTKDFLYLWGCTSDMREILAHVKARYPRAPLLGVGFSAGSNLLTKYLGETGTDSLIDVGLSVANSFDVKRTSEFLAKKWFHSRVMINILKNMLARNEDIFTKLEQRIEREHQEAEEAAAQALGDRSDSSPEPESSDATAPKPQLRRKLSLKRVKQVNNVLEWDEHFSLMTHTQFANLDDFYAAQSTTPEMVANIAVPLFNLHSLDDPIIPDSIVPKPTLHANPNVIMATTQRGGHLGYTEGLFPFNKATWMEQLTVEYFQCVQRPEIWRMIVEGRRESREKAAAKAAALSEEERAAAAAAPVSTHSSGYSQSSVDTQAPTREPSAFDSQAHVHVHALPPSRTASTVQEHSVFPHSHGSPSLRSHSSGVVLPLALPLPPSASVASILLQGSPLASPLAEDRLPYTPEPLAITAASVAAFTAELQQYSQASSSNDDFAPMELDVPADAAPVAAAASVVTAATSPSRTVSAAATSMEFDFTSFLAAPVASSPRKRTTTTSSVDGTNVLASPKRQKL